MSIAQRIAPDGRRPGLVVTLSGGGFRATLYHLGALRRLNASGLLSRVHAMSSVSGGSYLNAMLAMAWGRLRADPAGVFPAFDDEVTAQVLELCATNFRRQGMVADALDWSENLTEDLADVLDDRFGGFLLGDLPESPRFVFNACCYGTGNGFTFGRDDALNPERQPAVWMGDYQLGYALGDRVRLADAVLASSAFPVLPPLRLRGFAPALPGDASAQWERGLALGDGGLYDNLGLEPVYKLRGERTEPHFRPRVLLVSDAGGVSRPIPGPDIGIKTRAFFSIEQLLESGVGYRIRALYADEPRGDEASTATGVWRLGATGRDPAGGGYVGDDAAALARLRTDLDAFDDIERVALQSQGWADADHRLGLLGEPSVARPPELAPVAGLAAHLATKRQRFFGND